MGESLDITNRKFPPDHLRIFVHKGDVNEDLITTREKIKHLLFAFSSIENISEDFLNALPDVENLILNGNEKFPKLTKQFFEYFPKLTLIYIHNNDGLEIDEDALYSLEKLKILSIQGLKYSNLNKTVLAGLKSLKRLSMVKCEISNISNDAFDNLENLEEINLSSNNLTTIENGTFANLIKLKELSLQNNKLGNIDWSKFDTIPSLEYIDLCDNEMTNMSTSDLKKNLPKIQKINIISNCFTEGELMKIENELMQLSIKIE